MYFNVKYTFNKLKASNRAQLVTWTAPLLLAAKLGSSDLAPFRADKTMSEPNAGLPVFINTSIFWASALQALT